LEDIYTRAEFFGWANTWLMFKPPTPDAIWVPLRKVNWLWDGVASRNTTGDEWELGASYPTESGGLLGGDTTEYPMWDHNANIQVPDGGEDP